MRERPVLIASPRDDGAFREFAEHPVVDGAAAAEALEVELSAESGRLAARLMPKTSAELDLAARAQSG